MGGWVKVLQNRSQVAVCCISIHNERTQQRGVSGHHVLGKCILTLRPCIVSIVSLVYLTMVISSRLQTIEEEGDDPESRLTYQLTRVFEPNISNQSSRSTSHEKSCDPREQNRDG